jgi:hypothetical protein
MAQEPMKLRWLIAHQPARLFIRTAEAFAAELERELPGQFEIEILTMKDYIERYNDIPELGMRPGPVDGIESLKDTETFSKVEWKDVTRKWAAFFNAMRDSRIHLSQTQVTVIGGHLLEKFSLLDLPFLFKNHNHVSKVLDGSIGDQLCEELGNSTNVKGLAFTYSGGYRIVGSNHPIENVQDLKSTTITTVPMTRSFFSRFSDKAIKRNEQNIDETAEQVSNGGAIETTYLRFNGKNVLKTNHSMFLTTILVGNPFFETLNAEQQIVFKKAAKVVAKLERQWSLEDAQKFEDNAVKNGVDIREISEEDKLRLKEAAPSQYTFAYKFIEGARNFVTRIKTT